LFLESFKKPALKRLHCFLPFKSKTTEIESDTQLIAKEFKIPRSQTMKWSFKDDWRPTILSFVSLEVSRNQASGGYIALSHLKAKPQRLNPIHSR